MSAVWTVAAREIRARQIVLIAALVVAALPFAVGAANGPDSQETLALLLCLSFPFAVALGVGASMLSREVGERRLGFYFSRPISTKALWAGKVLAAVAVVLAAFACLMASFLASVPVRHVSPDSGSDRIIGIAFLALLTVFAMAVGHAAASMYRARSPWLVADIVLAVVCGTGFVLVVQAILEAGAFLPALRSGPRLPLVIGACVVALLGGAAAQLAVGRTDARRGHVALSVTVWASLFVILAAFATWQRWVLGASPAQAGGVGFPLVVSPAGEGIFFRGLTGRAGFVPFYLMDAGTGSFLRIPPDSEPLPTFAADGRSAAWVSVPELWEGDSRRRLSVVRLGDGVRLAARAPLGGARWWNSVLALHPDGQHAVIAGFEDVGLIDLDTAQVGASVPRARVTAADILADGRVRLFSTTTERSGGTALSVAVWSPHDGTIAETLRVPHAALLTRRGDVAVAATAQREKAILDLATGAERRVAGDAVDAMPRALVLADGRLALGMGDELRITDSAGTTLTRVALPAKVQVSALHEPEPGRLAVGLWSPILSNRGTLFVDAGTGAVLREERGLLPAGAQSRAGTQPEPGSLASRLFTNEDGALVALQPGGAHRVIVAAPGGGE
jgi:hypothetical protein